MFVHPSLAGELQRLAVAVRPDHLEHDRSRILAKDFLRAERSVLDVLLTVIVEPVPQPELDLRLVAWHSGLIELRHADGELLCQHVPLILAFYLVAVAVHGLGLADERDLVPHQSTSIPYALDSRS